MIRFGKGRFWTRVWPLLLAAYMLAATAPAGWAAPAAITSLKLDPGGSDGNIGAIGGSRPYTAEAYYIGDASAIPEIKLNLHVDMTLDSAGDYTVSPDLSGLSGFDVTGTAAFTASTGGVNVTKELALVISDISADLTSVEFPIGLYHGTTTPALLDAQSLDVTLVRLTPALSSAEAVFIHGDTSVMSVDVSVHSGLTDATSLDITGLDVGGKGSSGGLLWDADTGVKVQEMLDGAKVVGFYASADRAPGKIQPATSFDVTATSVRLGAGSVLAAAAPGKISLGTLTARVDGSGITLTPASRDLTLGEAATPASDIVVTVAPESLGKPASMDLLDGSVAGTEFTVNGTLTVTASSSDQKIKFSGTPDDIGTKNYKVRWLTEGGALLSADLTVNVEIASTITLSPTSMTFGYNDYTAKTLTINAPGSPTVTVSDTAKLTTGTVQPTSTVGAYTVTVAPSSGFTFGAGDTTAYVRVYVGSDTSNAKTAQVTLSGSGSSIVPQWSPLTPAHIAAIASVAGISSGNITTIEGSGVSVSMPASPAYDNEINRGNVAAYLALTQSVTSGGIAGMYFNNNYFMTLNSAGVGTNVAQQLYIPTSNADFHDHYDIVKVFGSAANSYSLGLSRLIPGFFTYNEASRTITANGVIAIIDSPAPTTTLPGVNVAYAGPGTQYGVVYTADYNGTAYLIICDGVTDGVAQDPIMLVQNYRNGSGGGCSAGFGAFVLLALGGIALLRRRGD